MLLQDLLTDLHALVTDLNVTRPLYELPRIIGRPVAERTELGIRVLVWFHSSYLVSGLVRTSSTRPYSTASAAVIQ